MSEQIFSVEIIETWVKKAKVIAENRTQAIAKVKAELAAGSRGECKLPTWSDDQTFLREVDVKLEWPDGNPSGRECKNH